MQEVQEKTKLHISFWIPAKQNEEKYIFPFSTCLNLQNAN